MSILEKLAKAAELSAFTDGFPFLSKTYGLGTGKIPVSPKFPTAPLPFDRKEIESRAIDRVHNLYSSVYSILLYPFPDVPEIVPMNPLPAFLFESGFSLSGLPEQIPLKEFFSLPYLGDPDDPRYAAAVVEADLLVVNTREFAENFFGEREERRWKWTDPPGPMHRPYERIELEMKKKVLDALFQEFEEEEEERRVKATDITRVPGKIPAIEYTRNEVRLKKILLEAARKVGKVWVRLIAPIWQLADFVTDKNPVDVNYDLFGPRDELTKLPPTPEALRAFSLSGRQSIRPLDFVVKDLPRGPATDRLGQEKEKLFADLLSEEPWQYAALRGVSLSFFFSFFFLF